jgi:hypothetical protein
LPFSIAGLCPGLLWRMLAGNGEAVYNDFKRRRE